MSNTNFLCYNIYLHCVYYHSTLTVLYNSEALLCSTTTVLYNNEVLIWSLSASNLSTLALCPLSGQLTIEKWRPRFIPPNFRHVREQWGPAAPQGEVSLEQNAIIRQWSYQQVARMQSCKLRSGSGPETVVRIGHNLVITQKVHSNRAGWGEARKLSQQVWVRVRTRPGTDILATQLLSLTQLLSVKELTLDSIS